MTSQRAQPLIDDYKSNTWLIHNHVDGISDDASLVPLPFEANSINWVLGYIVWRRNSALSTLGADALWDEPTTSMYKSGSPPIKAQAIARPFSDLIADLDQTQQILSDALMAADDIELDKVVENDRGAKPVIEHLQGFHWHETYHIGQLDILRSYAASKM